MDKSMTGDGAVVLDHETAKQSAVRCVSSGVALTWVINLARAYLAQAAEIEMTADRDSWRRVAERLEREKLASEARTADLLKALERYGVHKEPCRELTAETAKMFYKPRCICGLDDAIKESLSVKT